MTKPISHATFVEAVFEYVSDRRELAVGSGYDDWRDFHVPDVASVLIGKSTRPAIVHACP